jgi:hypothetical protein
MTWVFRVGNQTLRITASNAAEALRRAQIVFPGQTIGAVREGGQSGDANFRLINPSYIDAQNNPVYTAESTTGDPTGARASEFTGDTFTTADPARATGSDDGFAQFTKIGDTTNTGEAARIAALLANTPSIDPTLAGSLNERQRLGGIFRNFATDQGLNPTGLASSAVSQRFNPAFAAQTIGQQLAGQGFQSGLAPGAVNQDFRGFLDASGGFGNIDQTAGNVFEQLLSQSSPNLQNQQFLNPTVLETGGGFTNDARFILDLARQASRNRIGGAASFFGTPSEAELNTRFQTAPQANFAQFAADALGAG